jgi:hypothetical protein
MVTEEIQLIGRLLPTSPEFHDPLLVQINVKIRLSQITELLFGTRDPQTRQLRIHRQMSPQRLPCTRHKTKPPLLLLLLHVAAQFLTTYYSF